MIFVLISWYFIHLIKSRGINYIDVVLFHSNIVYFILQKKYLNERYMKPYHYGNLINCFLVLIIIKTITDVLLLYTNASERTVMTKLTSIGNWSRTENPLISWWLLMMSLVKKTNSTVFNTLYCLNVCFRGTNQDWVRKYQTQIHIINLIISELFVKELPCLPLFSLTLTYHPMLPEMLKPHASTVRQWYLVQWRQLPTLSLTWR